MTKKTLKQKASEREYRTVELRAKGDDKSYIVEGYATTFDKAYTLYESKYYKVEEVIDSKAFVDCDMSDVIMQYDHQGRVFARTRNNTLELKIDSNGLKVIADLSSTETSRQLYEDIKAGLIDRMSFGFVVAEDNRSYVEDYDNDFETCTRRITKISKLYDVSAVSFPANDMTSISARKFSDGVIAKFEAERLKRAKLKLKIKRMNMED